MGWPQTNTARRRGFHALAVLLGPLGAWALHGLASAGFVQVPSLHPSAYFLLASLLIAPVVEELAFRGAVQGWAAGTWMGGLRCGFVSLPNALASVLFAVSHVPSHTPVLAAATLLPSLVLGRTSEQCRSLWPCMLLHAWYNACFWTLFGWG